MKISTVSEPELPTAIGHHLEAYPEAWRAVDATEPGVWVKIDLTNTNVNAYSFADAARHRGRRYGGYTVTKQGCVIYIRKNAAGRRDDESMSKRCPSHVEGNSEATPSHVEDMSKACAS